jgi:LacI family transcriptional regulator
VTKIKEVAGLAGVAPSTVSRVLNDHPDVSAEMRARVMRAADQLGYQPNFLAQSLRTGATRTVGFVVRDISIPLFSGIVKGAEQELESFGYSVLLTNSLQNSALEAKHINVLRQRRVDGLILSLQSEANADTFKALHNVQVPIVLLDRELAGFAADAVLFDHASGVHDAVSALVELGHRNIGLLVGSFETRASRDRIRGFTLACEEAGIPAGWDNIVQLGANTPEAVARATASMLDPPRVLTALVAGDAQLGIAVLAAMNERKLRPARDLSLVICDDLELFRLLDPPISVVFRDAQEMGATAARMLMRKLSDGPSPPMIELLPTNFVPRGSTAAPSQKAKRAERQVVRSGRGDL